MNRRSFFSSLSSAVVGVYLGCHVNLPKIEADILQKDKIAYVGINPAWRDAPYELAFLVCGETAVIDISSGVELNSGVEIKDSSRLRVADPMRFNLNGEPVPKYAGIYRKSPTL